ncbi:MAG: hypothetical protein JWL59_3331 [Chthoniobacteraceae bacterium]|nr:hypothetical protein [Chthoniobacteraceae bacterium]
MPLKERVASRDLEVQLMKGSPPALGFPIFTGGFNDIIFIRSNGE